MITVSCGTYCGETVLANAIMYLVNFVHKKLYTVEYFLLSLEKKVLSLAVKIFSIFCSLFKNIYSFQDTIKA